MSAQAPEATPNAGPPANQTPPAPPAEDDDAALRRELKEARAEAARYRTQARDAAAQTNAAQTDAEKALAQREQAILERESRAIERENVATVATAAQALGFHDPRDAYALIKDDLNRNDDGTIKSPDRALKDLLREKPYLAVAAGGADASAGRGAGTTAGRTFNDAIRTAAGRQ